MRRTSRSLVIAFLIGWLVSSIHPAALAREKTRLTIFAAASLREAFKEIATRFTAERMSVEIQFNFGGSSTLALQLKEGAQADIFASANEKQMQVAVDADRIGTAPVIFARNRLILIVPADNPAGINSLADLAKPGLKLVLAAKNVPVRDYTDAMLEKMVKMIEYGQTYRDAVMKNLVSEEDNVRQVSLKVSLGEADAGIVYKSDVTPDIADKVLAFEIPDAINTIAQYPIAITDKPVNKAIAQSFVDYVLSDAGQDILEHWGFVSIRPEEVGPTPQVTMAATPAGARN